MSNVRVIAKRAGVSITTVSRVLNNHPHVSENARRRVLAISKEVGYSQSVGRRSVSNIAFVYTGEPSLGSPFDSALLAGLQDGLGEQGYDLMVLDARRARLPNETFSQMFMRKGVCGAILRTTTQARGLCESIAEEGFPTVVVADRFDNPKVSFVECDSRDACHEAIEYLVGLGHKQIAISVHVVDDSDHADRVAAYRQVLKASGIEYDPRLVWRIPATRDGGVQMVRRLVTSPNRPTAVFIADPLPAVGVLAEARKLGLMVPRDLSVLGFDDTEMRLTVMPELTAVCQDAVALGRESLAALVMLINREFRRPAAIRKTLRAWLEIHDSTSAPPKAPDASR